LTTRAPTSSARSTVGPCLVPERTDDGGPSGAEHAGLLGGDLAEGRSQELLVVEVDAHDRGSERLRDVRRVEPAPEPHLEHGHIDAPAAEMLEGGGGQPPRSRWDAG
jgi:hypothetical protein